VHEEEHVSGGPVEGDIVRGGDVVDHAVGEAEEGAVAP
jgi:hypothetical protein